MRILTTLTLYLTVLTSYLPADIPSPRLTPGTKVAVGRHIGYVHSYSLILQDRGCGYYEYRIRFNDPTVDNKNKHRNFCGHLVKRLR